MSSSNCFLLHAGEGLPASSNRFLLFICSELVSDNSAPTWALAVTAGAFGLVHSWKLSVKPKRSLKRLKSGLTVDQWSQENVLWIISTLFIILYSFITTITLEKTEYFILKILLFLKKLCEFDLIFVFIIPEFYRWHNTCLWHKKGHYITDSWFQFFFIIFIVGRKK